MDKITQFNEETLQVVEAFRAFLQAEEKIYSAYVALYGENREDWEKSPLCEHLDDLALSMKIFVGDSLECQFTGLTGKVKKESGDTQ